jgi:hypothetical protein
MQNAGEGVQLGRNLRRALASRMAASSLPEGISALATFLTSVAG